MAWRKYTTVRNLAAFAGVLAACLFMPSVVNRSVLNVFDEFRAPIDALPSQLSDLEKYWSLHSNSKRELIEAGRDLARLNALKDLKAEENASLRAQIVRLEKILNMPSQEKFKMEVARVCRRDLGAWWQQMTIRKGTLHGIREGYAVICADGVVGRISRAGLYTSTVELLSARRFRMAAHFEGDERPIIYQGAGCASFGRPRGVVEEVPQDLNATAQKPLKLVTSSLAGSFPDGLPIGEVKILTLKGDGIFKLGQVELPSWLAGLREVSVLVPVEDVDTRFK